MLLDGPKRKIFQCPQGRRGTNDEGQQRRQGGGLRVRLDGDNGPALLFVELVAHTLAQSLELSLRLGTVDIDHEILEVP